MEAFFIIIEQSGGKERDLQAEEIKREERR